MFFLFLDKVRRLKSLRLNIPTFQRPNIRLFQPLIIPMTSQHCKYSEIYNFNLACIFGIHITRKRGNDKKFNLSRFDLLVKSVVESGALSITFYILNEDFKISSLLQNCSNVSLCIVIVLFFNLKSSWGYPYFAYKSRNKNRRMFLD